MTRAVTRAVTRAATRAATGTVETSFVYVLASAGKGGWRTYVGWTTDLDRRLTAHNTGTGARSTRGRSWHLVYAERCADRREAMRREWAIKRDRRFRRGLKPVA
ncbi:MAG: GIY-YIG nuclease family protein [Alphaproteobacteria bacterium]|nr:GIY-YIG nuclease family protein [Alphaproteobacteria bacterium]